jgi:hypothetical protein
VKRRSIVVVENRPGAVMMIAGSEVLRQPADGTSIYAMSVPVTAAPAFLHPSSRNGP